MFLTGMHGSVTNPLLSKSDFVNHVGGFWKSCTFAMEFNRRPNSFTKWSSFKCTELRMFGLYGMEMIVRHFCSNQHIQQALYALTMGIRIICDPKLYRRDWRKAKALFYLFLTNTTAVWGDTFVSLAIHNLRHLPEETVKQGEPADNISTYKFENGLGHMKKCVRSMSHPLENISNYLTQHTSFVSRAGRPSTIQKFPKPLKKIRGFENRFSVIQFKNFRLSSIRKADSYFSANGIIRQFKFVEVDESGELWITSAPYTVQESAYFVNMANGEKMHSTDVRVVQVSRPGPEDLLLSSEISQKYMLQDFFGNLVAYPLLHT